MARSVFKWLTPAILCFFLAAAAKPHPLYIAVTDIKHDPKDRILEISCKMFTNDLESVLEKVSGSRVDLSAASDKAAASKLIGQYVERHLKLKVDGRPVTLDFVGNENENDGTWSYFQVNNVATVKRIDVTDELLYDGFSQQINIIEVEVGSERKSTKLDCPAANATFEF